MLSLREGARGARASTQSARLLRESEAAPTVSPIVTVHIGARPQACRSSENTVQQIMVRVGVGPTPMLAMRKLIIPAGHRALLSGVRVRKRSGAGRGRGAGRRRGTCGARMPNGLAVSEASAWMAVTEASEGEDNVGDGPRGMRGTFGGQD